MPHRVTTASTTGVMTCISTYDSIPETLSGLHLSMMARSSLEMEKLYREIVSYSEGFFSLLDKEGNFMSSCRIMPSFLRTLPDLVIEDEDTG